MNTTDFYQSLAKKLDISQAEASKYTRTLLETLQEVLEDTQSITLPDVGTFDSHVREERKSYIPHYESYMILPPKRVVDFRPASSLKAFVEQLEDGDE